MQQRARRSAQPLEGVMSTFFKIVEPWIFPVFSLVAFASISYRMWRGVSVLRAKGRSIRPSPPTDALFAESGASGNSERSFLTRLGGASRVLLVWVTRREFVVESIFPFNVFMYENPYDLEHRVPIKSLTSVEEGANHVVFVSFNDAEFQPHKLRLIVKNPSALVAALRSLGTPSNKSL
jgi:hypothetical protein